MLSGIATAILDNIISTIFDNIDKSVNDEHRLKRKCMLILGVAKRSRRAMRPKQEKKSTPNIYHYYNKMFK